MVGKEFLNSPHAKFTGTIAQIPTKTADGFYNSHFSDGTCANPTTPGEYLKKADCEAAGGTWTAFQGGCTTCHDAHQSTVEAIKEKGAEPMKRGCGINCHAGQADFSKINHSSGSGTPLEGGIEAACVTCHMPKPQGATRKMHVFRINTDLDYSTLPIAGATTPGICSDPNYGTKEACTAAGKAWSVVAGSAPDGTYTNAVWVDVDLACGQCHGGGANGGRREGSSYVEEGTCGACEEHARQQQCRADSSNGRSPTVTGRTVTFLDKSTDRQDTQAKLRIRVLWGDKKVSTGQPGGTFKHTYRKDGTYTISQTATDTEGLTGYNSVDVVIGPYNVDNP